MPCMFPPNLGGRTSVGNLWAQPFGATMRLADDGQPGGWKLGRQVGGRAGGRVWQLGGITK